MESGDGARLRSLLDIAKVVTAINRFEDLVELTAGEARRALGAASATVGRWDREAGVFRTLVNVGDLGPGEVRFPQDEVYATADYPTLRGTMENGQAYVENRDGTSPEAALIRTLHKDSALAVPIVVDNRVWGAIYATRDATQARFVDADLDFAGAVATQVAAGLVQADHLARISRLAFEDPLTGLANRRAVDEHLERVMGTGVPVTLILADINQLKTVNDTLGHEAGDRLITAVGDAVSQASGLVPDSLAARIGGDEFCIVVSGVAQAEAVLVAEELCRLVDDQPMSTGVSCGVASSQTSTGVIDLPARLLRLADAAQYRAKRSGSRKPVVAGAVALEVPEDAPSDRRARRDHLAIDGMHALESGLEILDRLLTCSVQTRLEAVADHALLLLVAAGWWVSRCDTDGQMLVSVSSSVQRFAENLDAQGVAQHEIGASFDLATYPASRRAMREASAFHVELGADGNDPAEAESLAVSGYTSVLVGGAGGEDRGWLVEVYGDAISLPFAGFEPVLRALVTVAVSGGRADSGAVADKPGRTSVSLVEADG